MRVLCEAALGGAGAGFEIVDSLVHHGWRLEPDQEQHAELVTSINRTASDLPGGVSAAEFGWPRINSLLNHKRGTGMQVEQALWALIYGEAALEFTVQAMLSGERACTSARSQFPPT